MSGTINLFNGIKLTFYNYNSLSFPYSMSDLSIPIILLGFIAFILLSLRKKSEATFLDLDSTNQMRALAIISIILSHYITRVFQPTTHYYWIFKDMGGVGVGVFLVLSGYGLMMSYMKKGLGKYYLIKRFLRVYLPYWLFMIPWIFLDYRLLNIHHSIRQLLEALFGIVLLGDYTKDVNPAMWYVMYIIVWYIIFFVIFSIKTSQKTRLLLIALAGAGIIFVSHQIIPHTRFAALLPWGDYAIYFPLGILIALNRDMLSNFFTKQPWYVYLIFFILFLIFGQYYAFFLAFALITAVAYLTNRHLNSLFLTGVGAISYELYLVHIPLLLKYDFILYRKPYWLSFLVFFILVCLLAYLGNRLVEKALLPIFNKGLKLILQEY